MSQIPMPGNGSPTRSHAGGWPTQSARLKGVVRTAPPSSISLHQNHKQRPAKRSTCGGEDDPKDARFELESFVIGFESVYEFIALLACKRLPIVGSVLASLHAAETLFLKKPRRDQCHKGYQSGQNNACAQLISLPFIGVRSAVSTNPLVFTGRYYQTENPDAAAKFPDGKTNFSSIIRTLKNTADVDGRTKVLAAYKPIKIRGYIRL